MITRCAVNALDQIHRVVKKYKSLIIDVLNNKAYFIHVCCNRLFSEEALMQ